jgi:hypothetical protein
MNLEALKKMIDTDSSPSRKIGQGVSRIPGSSAAQPLCVGGSNGEVSRTLRVLTKWAHLICALAPRRALFAFSRFCASLSAIAPSPCVSAHTCLTATSSTLHLPTCVRCTSDGIFDFYSAAYSLDVGGPLSRNETDIFNMSLNAFYQWARDADLTSSQVCLYIHLPRLDTRTAMGP